LAAATHLPRADAVSTRRGVCEREAAPADRHADRRLRAASDQLNHAPNDMDHPPLMLCRIAALRACAAEHGDRR